VGFGKRLALAAALLALLAIGFAASVWVEARGSFQRAAIEWSEESALAVLVRPLGPPSALIQAVPTQSIYSSAIVFDGDLWLAGRGGLERRNLSSGDLIAQWRPGAELPPAPLTGLAVARLGAASEARLLATTAGEGLLSVSAAGDIVQVLPEDAALADLTAVLPISTGGVLLGTERAGLLAWNGETLRQVHHLLSDQQVTALAGDEGDLWVGTLNEGVLHWAGGALSRFGEAEGLADRRVLSLVAGPEGVYAGTPLGVAVFRGDAWERTLAEGFFAAALRVSGEALLIGTTDEGVVEVPLNQQRRPQAPGPRTSAEGPQEVRAFAVSGSSVLAVTPSAAYVRAEDDSAWRPLVKASPTGLRDRNVAALYADSSSRLWVGYFDRGLDLLDSSFERVLEIESDQIFCVNRIKAARDTGTTAVATANGLAYFDANGNMRQILTEADGLIAGHVTDVAFSGDATVLATPAGLTFLDSSGAHSLYAFHGLVNNHVYSLGAAADKVLAGTLGGLSILEGGRVTDSFTTANSSLTHNWVSAISSFGGDWYIGLYGGGVMRLTSRGEWINYPELRGVEINPNAMISSSARVYAGTLDRGLLVFEPSTEAWRFVAEGLPSKNVTALALGPDVLYVGTDNGLARTNERELTGR
jgi:ligand-binding sensor domain-containing protein